MTTPAEWTTATSIPSDIRDGNVLVPFASEILMTRARALRTCADAATKNVTGATRRTIACSSGRY